MRRGAASGIIGRTDELAWFDGAVEDLVSRRSGGVFTVKAPAGGGKSRLLAEFTVRAAAAGVTTISSSCWDGPYRVPLLPWVDIVRAISPSAAPDIGLDTLDEWSSPVDRFVLFDAITSAVVDSAREGPLMVLIDDIHWSDVASLELIRFVARTATHHSVLLGAAYRPSDLSSDQIDQVTAIEHDSTVLDLYPLDRGETSQLVGADLDDERLTWVYEAGGGNPFVSLELAYSVRRSGVDGELAHLPRSILAIVGEQLGRLDDIDRSIIEVAAIQGREIDLGLTAAIVAVPHHRVVAACDTASERGIVELVERGRWRFVHTLENDAVVHQMDTARTAKLHRATARVMLARDDRRHEVVLGHLVAGSADARTIATTARLAASDAAGRAGWAEQADHLQLALNHCAEADELDLLVQLAAAQVTADRRGEARRTCTRAAELARARGEVAALARVALAAPPPLGSVELAEWHDPAKTALLVEALAGLDEQRHRFLRAEVMCSLAVALYWHEETGARAVDHRLTAQRRDELTAEALAIARSCADDRLLAVALNARLSAMWGPDGDRERPGISEELIDVGRRLGHRRHEFTGRMMRIMHLLRAGEISMVSAEIDAFDHDATLQHLRVYRWTAARWRSVIDMLYSRVPEAATQARAACAIGLPAIGETARQFRAAAIGWTMYFERDLVAIGENAATLAREAPNVPAWWVGAGWYGSEGGPIEYAREATTRLSVDDFSNVPRDVNWITTLTNFASVAFWLHDERAAESIGRHLAPYRGQRAILGVGYVYYGPVSRALALAASTIGDADSAATYFEESIAQSATTGDPYGPLAEFEFAVAIRRQPDRYPNRSAERYFARAIEGFEGHGLDAFADRVRVVRGGGHIAVRLVPHGRRWSLTVGSATAELPALKGLRALVEVLRRPGLDLHVLDVVSAIQGGGPVVDTRLERLDRTAIDGYRRRLAELTEELDDADGRGDAELSRQLSAEHVAISAELSGGLGLGGRFRGSAANAERARVMLTKQIGRAIDRIADCDEGVGRHLRECVTTGTYLSYRPREDAPNWSLDVT